MKFLSHVKTNNTEGLLGFPFPVHILELHLQEFHLVTENAAVSEYKVFSQVGHIGYGEKGHACFVRGVAPLAGITPLAGCDYIAPLVAPSPRNGFDVVTGELAVAELTTAI